MLESSCYNESVNVGVLMLINVLISVLITVEPLILVALNFGVQVH